MLPIRDIFTTFAVRNVALRGRHDFCCPWSKTNIFLTMKLRDITQHVTPATLWLLVANVVMYIATELLELVGVDLRYLLGTHFWQGSDFAVYQLLTGMFMHDGLLHLFFNMFALFTFGPWLERAFGTPRFLIFYFVCGLGAGVVQELVWQFTWQSQMIPVQLTNGERAEAAIWQVLAEHPEWQGEILNSIIAIGASGAMFGVLLAFAVCYPNVPLYLFFIPIPIKAKWAVLGYGVLELIFGVSGTFSGVAHFAHLGGLLFGGILIILWLSTGTLKRYPHYGK